MTTAADRALSMVGRGMYILGAGNTLDPLSPFAPSSWVDAAGVRHEGMGVDCSRFALWSLQMPAHVAGLNHGPHATTSDDLNSDSMIESAIYEPGRFFELVTGRPQPGDVLCYKSIWFADGECNDEGRGTRRWIGHEMVIVKVPTVWMQGDYRSLTVVQAHGPNGCSPCVAMTDGSVAAHHAVEWDAMHHPLRGAFVIRPAATRS